MAPNAKKKLNNLVKGKEFSSNLIKNPNGGRSSELIQLSCDSLKQFCLMAETEQGRNIRQYFIEAEKKWKIVEQFRPEVAQQAEMIKLQTELARYNASFAENQRFIMEKSEAIINLHGPQMLALIQGRPDAVVEKTERVTETVVVKDGRSVSFEGKSLAELRIKKAVTWEFPR